MFAVNLYSRDCAFADVPAAIMIMTTSKPSLANPFTSSFFIIISSYLPSFLLYESHCLPMCKGLDPLRTFKRSIQPLSSAQEQRESVRDGDSCAATRGPQQ